MKRIDDLTVELSVQEAFMACALGAKLQCAAGFMTPQPATNHSSHQIRLSVHEPYRIEKPTPGTRDWAKLLCEMGACVEAERWFPTLQPPRTCCQEWRRSGPFYNESVMDDDHEGFPDEPQTGWMLGVDLPSD